MNKYREQYKNLKYIKSSNEYIDLHLYILHFCIVDHYDLVAKPITLKSSLNANNVVIVLLYF